MNRTVAGEHAAGLRNGAAHRVDDLIHRENLIKCRKGRLSDQPLVNAYWSGYAKALDEARIPTLAGK